MRRYKIYLVGGKVLEVEAKSARLETGPIGGDRLVLRGEKENDRVEFFVSNLIGYAPASMLVSEEAA